MQNAYKIALALILFGIFLPVNARSQPFDWSRTNFVSSKTTITAVKDDKLLIRQEDEIIVTDETGKMYCSDAIRETDFVKMRSLEAIIYDGAGKKVAELQNKDIKESSISYSSIYVEHKTKFYDLSVAQLPVRIVRVREYELKSAFFWPDWDPQRDVDVMQAQLEVILQEEVDFDYRNIGSVAEGDVFVDARGRKHYRWAIENVPAFRSEYRYTPEDSFQHGVKFTTKHFELDNFAGSSESWQSFGAWYHRLSEQQLHFKKSMPVFAGYRDIADAKERVRTIYRLLQDKTRYVQIYLGIDGWRPHHVEDIHASRYGDCKDLSAYMIAMLAQAGIEAYPALVLTRDRGWVDPEFPGNQFNHCIAVVPTADDTLWLECTSDLSAYNDPPANIEGVNVLLVKPEGSALLRTPTSPATANRSLLEAEAILFEDRSLHLNGTLSFTGNLAMDIRSILQEKTESKRREWLAQRFSHVSSNAQCSALRVEELENPDSTLSLHFTAKLDYFAKKAGSRYIMRPRLYHSVGFEGEEPGDRTMALLNMTRFVQEDVVEFVIPSDWSIRHSKTEDSISSPFGQFKYELTQDGSKLLWKSSFVSTARKVALEDYHDYYIFMTNVKKTSSQKMILSSVKS